MTIGREKYEAFFGQKLPADIDEDSGEPGVLHPDERFSYFRRFVRLDQEEGHGRIVSSFLGNLLQLITAVQEPAQCYAHVDPAGSARAEVLLWIPDEEARFLPMADSVATFREAADLNEAVMFCEGMEEVFTAADLDGLPTEARAEVDALVVRARALEGRIGRVPVLAFRALNEFLDMLVIDPATWHWFVPATRAQHLATRGLWISELLTAGTPRHFALAPPPPPDVPYAIAAATPRFTETPAEALYWLFRSFFCDESAIFADVLPRSLESRSPVVQSAAAVLADVARGRRDLGSIPDLIAVRDAYLAAQRAQPA